MREELITNKTTSKCFNITAGQIDSMRINTNVETTVRLYDGKSIGVAGRVGSCDIDELRREAEKNLALGIEYPDSANPPLTRSVDVYKEIIPAGELVAAMKKLMKRLAEENPRFTFGNKILLDETEKSYVSGDTKLFYRGNSLAFSITIKHKGSANIMDETYESETNEYSEDDVANGVKTICDAFLKSAELPEGNEAIVAMDASAIGHVVSHLSADYYYHHLSLFDGKFGEKIFSDKLTISADRNSKRAKNIPFFDAEGVIAEDDCVNLVEGGVFNGLLATKKTAAKYGCRALGTAGAFYDSVPQITAAGLTVKPTAEDISSLAGGKEVVYVSVTSGGDVTADGTLSLPVQASYLMKNGKLVGKLPGYAITCNVKDLFGDRFIGVAKNGVYKNSAPYIVAKANIVNREK